MRYEGQDEGNAQEIFQEIFKHQIIYCQAKFVMMMENIRSP